MDYVGEQMEGRMDSHGASEEPPIQLGRLCSEGHKLWQFVERMIDGY